MTHNVKPPRSLVCTAAYGHAFAQLDAALVENTHPDITEHEKTQLWLLKIFGRAPDPEKIPK
jgi:hypothetical protein